MSSPRRAAWIWPLAVLLALAAAALDLALADVSISFVVITAFAMFVTWAAPERPWRWGLLFGTALPLSHLAARLVFHRPPSGGTLAGLMAYLPALVGAYLGAFLNKMVRALRGIE